jgi:glycerol kinase
MKNPRYSPSMEAAERERRIIGWHEAVKKVLTI